MDVVPAAPPAPPCAPARASIGQRWALLAITLAAGIWRAATLGQESLWIDEGMSIHLARLSFAEILADRTLDGHPPSYFFLLRVWVGWFGDSPESVRAMSVIPGTLVVPLLYLVAARWRGPTAGLFAAALAAGSRYLVYYSQEARNYAFLAFFATAAFWALDRALERASPGRLFAWSLALAATLWSSVFGLVVFATQALYLAGRAIDARGRALPAGMPRPGPRAALPWIVAAAGAVLAFSPWLLVLARRAKTAHTLWMDTPHVSAISDTMVAFAGSNRGLALLAPALLAGTWYVVGRRGADRRRGLLLLAWLGGPILVLWLLSQVTFPMFVQRGTIAANGAFVVLAALGLDALRPRPRWFAVAAVLAAAALAFGAYRHVDRRDKEDWRGLAAIVAEAAAPGDMLLLRAKDEVVVYGTYARRDDLFLGTHADAADGRIFWGEQRVVFLVVSPHVRRVEEARAALRSVGFTLREVTKAPLIALERWQR